MRIGGVYSFKDGERIIQEAYARELEEIIEVIRGVQAADHKTKISTEKTMPGGPLFSPIALNEAFKAGFQAKGWRNHKMACVYTTDYYTSEYQPKQPLSVAFRDMDFVKNDVGVEVQFGKYAFMVYNVCAKMTIFAREGVIKVGVEIVPLKELANEMSTGVSYFEQFVWDLEHRGVADIDVPVLILGITE
jgi:hypothetical protein